MTPKEEIEAFIGHLKVFCDKLFPGADFQYQGIDWKESNGAYYFSYYPNKTQYAGVRIYIPEHLLKMRIMYYRHKNWWISGWRDIDYTEIYLYRVHLAYQYLESVGVKPGTEKLPDQAFKNANS